MYNDKSEKETVNYGTYKALLCDYKLPCLLASHTIKVREHVTKEMCQLVEALFYIAGGLLLAKQQATFAVVVCQTMLLLLVNHV